MFRWKTAWFSRSVPQDRLDFWKVEGGSITGWREADYLFSADATCPDTMRIFESKDYILDKFTVFHSLFLSTCEKRQSVKSVTIGHYVLPPASVQDDVRKVVGRLIWELEDEETIAKDEQKSFCLSEVAHSEQNAKGSISEASGTDSSESEVLFFDHLRSPVSCVVPGYVSIENLPKYCGDLHDVHPGLFRCPKCKAYLCYAKKH